MTQPDAGAELRDLRIDKVVPGGDGMARLDDGRVAFVTGAFPGDVVRPLAVEARKGHIRITKFSLIEPRSERVSPPCPVAEACGGCDWMALSRTAQLEHKAEAARDTLVRTGGFPVLPAELAVVAVPPDLGYRSRVRFHVEKDGRLGYFARGTHTVVEVPGCVVCRPEIDEALRLLRRVPKDSLAALSELEVRCADAGAKVSVRLVPRVSGGAGPTLRAVVAKVPAGWAVTLDEDRSTEGGEQRFPLPGGTTLLAAPGVFTQVNWSVNTALVAAVVQGAEARGIRRFLDAYAGAGNFSLPLLARGMSGVSVERDARAVACARRAAAEQSLDASGFVADDAEHRVAGLARAGESFDLVLLDPPRTGARDVLGSVVKLGPPFIACCSCDPVTLSRDLRILADAGYRLDEVRAFDMFPATHHLETLAWLSRPRE